MNTIERSRLIDFLYILGRDHLPIGSIESIMFDQVDTEPSSYCNTYLEEYACDLADRLLDLERPITSWKHIHKSADSKVKWCGEQKQVDESSLQKQRYVTALEVVQEALADWKDMRGKNNTTPIRSIDDAESWLSERIAEMD